MGCKRAKNKKDKEQIKNISKSDEFQLSLLNLSIATLLMNKLIYGIAIAVVAVNTPMIMSRYMIKPSASPINAMGNTARSMRALIPRKH